MTSIYKSTKWLLKTSLLAGAISAPAFAQTQASAVDNEVRGAFILRCAGTARPGIESVCLFPDIPEKKRFAVREASAYCVSEGMSVNGFGLHLPSPNEVFILRSQLIKGATNTFYSAHEPLYSWLDRSSTVHASIAVYSNDSTGEARCYGYLTGILVDMP